MSTAIILLLMTMVKKTDRGMAMVCGFDRSVCVS